MLPSGCKRVEYIESTGSQYIDTGVIGRNGLSIEGAFMANSLENAKIMGCYSPGRFYPLAFNDGVLALGYDSSWYNSTKTIQAGIKYNFAVSITANRQTVSIDGETCISGANTGNITTNVNMYLCAFNDSDLYPDGYFKGRIYPTKFKLNGTLVRDYIPCIDANGDANLWDDVNETLAEKVGTFIAGPEAVPQLPQLITDRTQNDVEEAKRIRAKLAAGEALTDAESAAYFAGLRGCYNASDMNRVGNAVRYIADRLNAEGYGVVVHPRIGWTMKDIVRKSDWKAYLDEVQKLRYVLSLLPTTPEITDAMYDGIGYIEANHIEQILVDLDTLITRMIAGFYYSGELFAGEV